jgi:NUMOD3 motif
MKTGNVYLYTDPVTGQNLYGGSTQDGDHMRRHREHLKEKDRLGRYLRAFPKGQEPQPIELWRGEFDDAWLLHSVEWFYQTSLGTRLAFGGFNIQDPAWFDYAAMGREGGPIGCAALDRWRKNNPEKPGEVFRDWVKNNPEKAAANARKAAAGVSAALKGKAKSEVTRQRMRESFTEERRRMIGDMTRGKTPHNKGKKHSPDTRRKMSESHTGTHAARRGGAVAGHIRWHFRRGIVSKSCSLCQSMK